LIEHLNLAKDEKSTYIVRRQTIPHINATLREKCRLYCACTTSMLENLVYDYSFNPGTKVVES